MNSKKETYWILQTLFPMIQTQYNFIVKMLRIDNGTEFIKHSVKDFLNSQGTIHQTICVYTSQQNSTVERRHKYILEVVSSLRFQVAIALHL